VLQTELIQDLTRASWKFWEDEFIASSLYRAMSKRYKGKTELMRQLASMEDTHMAFWKQVYYDSSGEDPHPNLWTRMKIFGWRILMTFTGYSAFTRYLEVSESSAIREYSSLLEDERLKEKRDALKAVLMDEVKHETLLVQDLAGKKSSTEDVRNAVYGMVDALVEVLAVVVGLASALANPVLVALAGVISASAGTLSMAAGAYLSSSSQLELVQGKIAEVGVKAKVQPEELKDRVINRLREWGMRDGVAEEVGKEMMSNPALAMQLETSVSAALSEESVEDPKSAAWHAGLYYALGAIAPVAPFAAMIGGTLGIALAVVFSVSVLSFASATMAMLSGVGVKRKVLQMDLVALGAAGGTFIIGFVARHVLGISI
jgi:VIT1/CCC1 family predicted Fe2+/Mn2+ transporter